MRLVTYRWDGGYRIAAEERMGLVDLERATVARLRAEGDPDADAFGRVLVPADPLAFLRAGERALAAARESIAYAAEARDVTVDGTPIIREKGAVSLAAPVPRPGKIIAIGLNYADHAKESGAQLPAEPVIFPKWATSVVGPGEPVIHPGPEITEQLDYEVELAVVIGKAGKRIPEAAAWEHVAGYTVLNDISARDLQFRDGQWMKGKALDTFAPMGPCLVTKDAIADPHDLTIRLRLNGELMQDSSTAQLIFGIPRLIAFLSRLMTLEPGDVISTGTPSGVGFARQPPVFLQPGDLMQAEIEGIGVLENRVVAA
ncbi:MAG TPA: fumarylacetoacetate hydrolase family protein [Limnochordia bacterium]